MKAWIWVLGKGGLDGEVVPPMSPQSWPEGVSGYTRGGLDFHKAGSRAFPLHVHTRTRMHTCAHGIHGYCGFAFEQKPSKSREPST